MKYTRKICKDLLKNEALIFVDEGLAKNGTRIRFAVRKVKGYQIIKDGGRKDTYFLIDEPWYYYGTNYAVHTYNLLGYSINGVLNAESLIWNINDLYSAIDDIEKNVIIANTILKMKKSIKNQ